MNKKYCRSNAETLGEAVLMLAVPLLLIIAFLVIVPLALGLGG